MAFQNVEIKARCDEQDRVRDQLLSRDAVFRGIDHQVDTYFKADSGRLKLREGTIENALVYYQRPDIDGPKVSQVELVKTIPGSPLKGVLTRALGVLVVVDKMREIYFIDNVKFHLDRVDDLGSFVEIEAIDADGSLGLDRIQQQCRSYRDALGINDRDLISHSYSDMLLAKMVEANARKTAQGRITGEYLHLHGRDSRTPPSSWLGKGLQLEQLSHSSVDADYPVNRSESRVYYCPAYNVALSLTEYPERGCLPSYADATSIKGEFAITARGRNEDVRAIEEVIREIIGKQEHARMNNS